jgi:hypothetical protein
VALYRKGDEMGTRVRATLWIAVLVIMALSPITPVSAENPDQTFETLMVTLVYDKNHDGLSEGVGEGRTVNVYRDGEHFASGVTNQLSAVLFLLPFGEYDVVGYAGLSELPIFIWKCSKTIQFDEPGQIELIRWKEVGIHKVLLPMLGF